MLKKATAKRYVYRNKGKTSSPRGTNIANKLTNLQTLKHNRKSYGKDKHKKHYMRKLHSIEQEQSSMSTEMNESGEESSSSDGSHKSHNSQSYSLLYEIGSIYYIDDIDGENNNTEQIFTDLVDDNGIKFTVRVDTGAQVNVLLR